LAVAILLVILEPTECILDVNVLRVLQYGVENVSDYQTYTP